MHAVLPALTVVLLALSNAADASAAKALGRRDFGALSDLSAASAHHLERRAPSLPDAHSNPRRSSSSSSASTSKLEGSKKKKRNCRRRHHTSTSSSSSSSSTSTAKSSSTTSSKASITAAPSSTTTTKSTKTTTTTTTTTTNKASAPSSTLYSLTQESLGGYSFFDNWDFFTYDDPTHGQVEFVGEETCWDNGLCYVPDGGNSTAMRVDSWSWLTYGANRQSVRITSKEKVKYKSLTIVDLEKMPYGPTVWPAFWTVGDSWPYGGEIDIVEGVHDLAQNQMTLHTGGTCTIEKPMNATGTILVENCNVVGDSQNLGCGIQETSTTSFGSAFNKAGGGVYVMKWDEEGIAIYFFQRGEIPDDITSGAPNPDLWGLPSARYGAGACDPSTMFGDQTIVFDITIGGDWAGSATYNAMGYIGDWQTAVMDPTTYTGAEFEVNYVKVYNKD